ncbi:hypothetical protein [Solitalea longa]|nr:hypothetical protein [Solitalea longa]
MNNNKIELIQKLINVAKHEIEITGRIRSISYFTIDTMQNIKYCTSLLETLNNNIVSTFISIERGWTYYYHEIYTLIDQNNEVIHSKSISLKNWNVSLHYNGSNLRFKLVPHSINGQSIELTDDHSQKNSLQNTWNNVIEIDENCTSYKEALIYKKFQEERSNNKTLAESIANYKQELENKNNLISQHEELLETISNIVKSQNSFAAN